MDVSPPKGLKTKASYGHKLLSIHEGVTTFSPSINVYPAVCLALAQSFDRSWGLA